MTSEKAKQIVQEVLENKKKEQKIVVTIPKDSSSIPHNGTSSKTSAFLDSLKDKKEMAKLIDKTSNMVKSSIEKTL